MTSTLRLVTSTVRPATPISTDDVDLLHVETERSSLFSTITDKKISWVLKKPAILQMAKRGYTEVISIAENLLESDDEEKRTTAIDALTILGTDDALNRLIMLCACSISNERWNLINALATCLTAAYVRPFSILVREFVFSKELDVTNWTSIAINVLQETAKLRGIKVITDMKVQN